MAKIVIFAAIVWILMVETIGGFGIRFVIEKPEECLSHNVQYQGETVHVSFVVIKTFDHDYWHYFSEDGVDLVIKGPTGEQIHDFRDKFNEKYEFVAPRTGVYRFCFKNKSPFHETIDFDVHVGHFMSHYQHAKDEHFNPLLEEISKLEEALDDILFEQHYLEAQTDRQTIIIEAMGKRAVKKAIFESLLLIGTSLLQYIPEDFVEVYGDDLPKIITLEVVDLVGKSWKVAIKNVKGELCLAKGWTKFIEDTRLEQADFLVFRFVNMSV